MSLNDKNPLLAANVQIGYGLGWSFTPLAMLGKSPGKRPVLTQWESRPRESLEQAVKWAHQANVGLRTGSASGGLLVIDLDVAKPWYDEAAVKALDLDRNTVIATTGSGGYHLYYRLPAGLPPIGNHTGAQDNYALAPAVDIRCEGGQVVFPGSLHVDSGRLYAWWEGHSPSDLPVAPIQPHILARIQEYFAKNDTAAKVAPAGQKAIGGPVPESPERRYGLKALAAEVAKLSAIAEGGRGSELNKAAFSLGQLVASGHLNEAEVTAGLLAACSINGLIAKDGRRDVEYHIAKSLAAGMKEPRSVSPPPASVPPPAAPPSGGQACGTAGEAPAEEPPIGADGRVMLGCRNPATGRLVLDPKKTLPTARAYIRQFAQWQPPRAAGDDAPPPAALRTLHAHGGRLLSWRAAKNRYEELEAGAIAHRLTGWLHEASRYGGQENGRPYYVPFDSNPATVEAALKTITAACHLDVDREPPLWLSGQDREAGRGDPRELLVCQTGNLDLAQDEWSPATPDLFTFNSLDFDYDPHAPEPAEWLRFLKQLWPADGESIGLLQEWFGYCLVSDNRQQKMLLLQGPKRCGKGTIAAILGELVGRNNIVGPTVESMCEQFGLQQLIGKSVAVISDARFHGSGIPTMVERLLVISGDGTITIRRMYQAHLTTRLVTRFVILSNELPRFVDAAGALASRFLILRLVESFYGREDLRLQERLLGELPGILLWAIDGWRRLRERGKFVEPASSLELKGALVDISSPISVFVRDRCIVAANERVKVDDLYAAYRTWCEGRGHKSAPSIQSFGRDLNAAFPGVVTRRNRHADFRFYDGLSLKDGTPFDPDGPAMFPAEASAGSQLPDQPQGGPPSEGWPPV